MVNHVTKKDNIFKCGGYADDIFCVTLLNNKNLQQIFNEYERLTFKSGLELNADKTEILVCRPGNDDNGQEQHRNGQVRRQHAAGKEQAMPAYQRAMPLNQRAMRENSHMTLPITHENLMSFEIKYINKMFQINPVSKN
jgi:hypothetical protein